MFSRAERAGRGAFTLLELVTCILIIVILMVIFVPVAQVVRSRLDQTRCMENMRNLHVAAALYLQEHRCWPQIVTPGASGNPEVAARWIDSLRPYGLDQTAWICPTIQRLLQGPDLTKDENRRLDYLATPFDAQPQTPYRWSTQPWFIERGNMHGNGNLIIFPDGHIQSLYDVRNRSPLKSTSPGH